MKKRELLLLSFFAILTVATWVSCKKDSGGGSKTPSASIKDTSQTVNESAGTASVIVNLSAAASQALKLNFTLSGSAILNGDYEPDSVSSITIPAGSSSGTLKFTIFDDRATENNTTIHVKFTSTGNVTFATSEATITIQDNDPSRKSTGLQTDLLWDAGSLVDLDLYVVNNVVFNPADSSVTDLTVVDSSQADRGFESVLINNSKPDGDYYLVPVYVSGTRAVTFTLSLAGPNIGGALFPDTFASTEVGSAFLVGPIHKLGSAYNFRQSRPVHTLPLKRYVYRGKFL